jgi:hypothetical protein
MTFNFYEVVGGCIPHECDEHVEFDSWDEAEEHGKDLSLEWGNKVRIERMNHDQDGTEIVGAVCYETRVNKRVDFLVDQHQQREQRARENQAL